MKKLKMGVIGLGGRGRGLVRDVLLKNKDLNIIAVCDVYDDRVAKTLDVVRGAGMNVKAFTDYKEALNTAGLDVVFVFTDWSTHAEIAIRAMKQGLAVASEVGCEYSLENCYELIRTHEQTGSPYMFVENCCWG